MEMQGLTLVEERLLREMTTPLTDDIFLEEEEVVLDGLFRRGLALKVPTWNDQFVPVITQQGRLLLSIQEMASVAGGMR